MALEEITFAALLLQMMNRYNQRMMRRIRRQEKAASTSDPSIDAEAQPTGKLNFTLEFTR
ncbi:hypothetical protein ABVT39_016159 [Epinephelus coioides]